MFLFRFKLKNTANDRVRTMGLRQRRGISDFSVLNGNARHTYRNDCRYRCRQLSSGKTHNLNVFCGWCAARRLGARVLKKPLETEVIQNSRLIGGRFL